MQKYSRDGSYDDPHHVFSVLSAGFKSVILTNIIISVLLSRHATGPGSPSRCPLQVSLFYVCTITPKLACVRFAVCDGSGRLPSVKTIYRRLTSCEIGICTFSKLYYSQRMCWPYFIASEVSSIKS